MSLVIRLPLPDRGLSPNARLHWARKRKLVQEAREEAMWTTAVETNIYIHRKLNVPPMNGHRYKLDVAFRLPDARRRDVDNLFASCKPYFDGIADALGVDDQRFEFSGLTRTVDRDNPGVVIEVST